MAIIQNSYCDYYLPTKKINSAETGDLLPLGLRFTDTLNEFDNPVS